MPPKIITMTPKKKAKTKIKPNEAIIKHFRELCALYKLKKTMDGHILLTNSQNLRRTRSSIAEVLRLHR